MQKKYPSYFGNLSNEAILAGEASKQYTELKNAIFEKAKAQAFADKIAENELKIFELQQKGGEKVGKTIGILQGILGAGVGTSVGGLFAGNVVSEIEGLNQVNEKLKESINVSDLLWEESEAKETKRKTKQKTDAEKLAEDLMKIYEDLENDKLTELEKSMDKTDELLKRRLETEKEIAFKIRELVQKNQDEELKAADKQLDEDLKKVDAIRKKEDEQNKWRWEQRKKDEEDRKKNTDQTIKDAAEIGNTVMSLKKSQLEREFEMAEGNAEKQAAINKKIANLEKQQALFNIAINTAVAISKVIGQTGIFGLAAWIPIAAIGAAQSAAVLAQKVPKFAKGTDYAPNEFIAGEAGREIVKTQSGDVYMVDKATHFKGNRFKGATVYTNKETEQVIKESGRNQSFIFDTKELRNEMIAVKKAIIKKPVLITDNSGRVVGKESNNYREIYLNRLRNGR